ncbi:MAG: 50S ribosomal protein L23 [Patescibacteria group bacterium]
MNTKPKPRRLGRNIGMKPGYKKVIVTLKEGQKLDILPH